MQTSPHAASPNWTDFADAETIARVEAAIEADPTFLAEAQQDLNGAVERRMGIRFSIPLVLKLDGGCGRVGPMEDVATPSSIAAAADGGYELTDADLDLVSGGSSMRTCGTPEWEP